MAGQIRSRRNPVKRRSPPRASPASGIPSIADRESSQQPPTRTGDEQPQEPGKSKPPRLTLPVTTLAGTGPEEAPTAAAGGEKVDEARQGQQDLLAEFDKIADELNRCWPISRGARWSSGSRPPRACNTSWPAGSATRSAGAFGRRGQAAEKSDEGPGRAVDDEDGSSHNVSLIMDDMQAYFERRRFIALQDGARRDAAAGRRRQPAPDSATTCERKTACRSPSASTGRTRSTAGPRTWSIRRAAAPVQAQVEEQPAAVARAGGAADPGGEVNLREETRVAEQAKPAARRRRIQARPASSRKRRRASASRVDKV